MGVGLSDWLERLCCEGVSPLNILGAECLIPNVWSWTWKGVWLCTWAFLCCIGRGDGCRQ